MCLALLLSFVAIAELKRRRNFEKWKTIAVCFKKYNPDDSKKLIFLFCVLACNINKFD